MTQGAGDPTHGPPQPDPADNNPTPPTEPPPSLLRRAWARLCGAWVRLGGAGRWLRAHARHALVVGVITAVVGALATVAADQLPKLFEDPPPPCPGAGCENKDPNKTAGCAADAATWEPKEGNPVRVQLRYSKVCGAVWGRIVNGEPGDMVTLQVTGGAARSASIDYGHDKYTSMAIVATTFRVRLCAVPSTNPNAAAKWVTYCYEATEHSFW